MIIVAVGANLPADGFPSPGATCEAAVARLQAEPGISVTGRSPWYETEPVPPSDQPWFVNGVLAIATDLAPAPLMRRLHAVEAAFGRVRRARNEARPLDLDLIDFDGRIVPDDGEGGPILPHPRMHERAFVLLPLCDLNPEWRHPRTGRAIGDLVAALPADGPGIRQIGR